MADELQADAIRWNIDPAPWPESSDLLALTVEVLPPVEDDRLAALIERLAIRAQRTDIEVLRLEISTSTANQAALRAALTAAEEDYVAALAAHDRGYAQEIAIFRAAVEDIAATPEGRRLRQSWRSRHNGRGGSRRSEA